jgi:uncharacterized protein
MLRKGMFVHLSPLSKLLLMILLSLASVTLFMLLGWIAAFFVVDDLMLKTLNISQIEEPGIVGLMKYFQIVNQFGLFIVPPFIFAWLDSSSVSTYLRLRKTPDARVIILSTILIFAVLPLVHWSASVNELFRLPGSLSGLEKWMRDAEESARIITEAFLNEKSYQGFIINMIMIAMLPAIGEELFFRGVIQQLLQKWFKNIHLAIIITAIVFSALHLQFYGFLPRTLLGVMFGYLFVITGSLWVPVLAHFVNNGAAVVASYLYQHELIGNDYHELGSQTGWLPVMISAFIVAIIFVGLHRVSSKNRT